MLLGLLGCSTATTTFYQRLGGADGVDAITYQLLVYVSQDERVVERFKGVDIERFRAHFARHLCHISGGGCQDQGDTMRQIHAGYHYTNTEFNAIVENLIRAMEQQQIPTRAQNQLLALLAPYYQDVVYQ
jgi:hemoglobin